MTNGACPPCKAKKKRCIHRDLPAEVLETESHAAIMPAPSVSTAKGRRKAAEGSEAAKDKITENNETTDNNETVAKIIADKNAKEMRPGPAGSSDELSSASEVEKKPVKNRAKRTRRSKVTASQRQREAPNLPTDPVEAACAMSIHTVFARELQAHIQQFSRDMQASRDAHLATMTSAQAIQDTVDCWIDAWASGR